MPTPSIAELERAIQISEQIEKLNAELESLLGGAWASSGKTAGDVVVSKGRKKKRGMSAAGRAKIAAAQRARWAKAKTSHGPLTAVVMPENEAITAKSARKKKRKLSPEARAKIVAAVKARWAREKKGKA